MDRLTYCSYMTAREVLAKVAENRVSAAEDNPENGTDLTDARILLAAENMIVDAMPGEIPEQ